MHLQKKIFIARGHTFDSYVYLATAFRHPAHWHGTESRESRHTYQPLSISVWSKPLYTELHGLWFDELTARWAKEFTSTEKACTRRGKLFGWAEQAEFHTHCSWVVVAFWISCTECDFVHSSVCVCVWGAVCKIIHKFILYYTIHFILIKFILYL